jgi:hypothetical protein
MYQSRDVPTIGPRSDASDSSVVMLSPFGHSVV